MIGIRVGVVLGRERIGGRLVADCGSVATVLVEAPSLVRADRVVGALDAQSRLASLRPSHRGEAVEIAAGDGAVVRGSVAKGVLRVEEHAPKVAQILDHATVHPSRLGDRATAGKVNVRPLDDGTMG